MIPENYEKTKDWGKQSRVFGGINADVRGGNLRLAKRTTDVNQGLWRRYRVNLVDPGRTLQFSIQDRGERDDRQYLLISAQILADVEARFELYADRPEVARATVTPTLCANLVALATAQGSAPFQAAFTDGRFFLALRRRGDRFRVGSLFRPIEELESEAARVLDEVQVVHRLIDHLHGDRPPLEPARKQTVAHNRDKAPGPVVRA